MKIFKTTFLVIAAAGFTLSTSYSMAESGVVTNSDQWSNESAGIPQVLQNYDPSHQIRFRTPAEADAKRQELISFIWPAGLPINTLPVATTNIGAEVFSKDLKDLNSQLVTSVDLLDANVSGLDFHSIAYLIHPQRSNANTSRLVIAHQGHQGGLGDGVGDAINRLLESGFTVLAMQMPMVGWNKWRTITLPDGGGTVTITNKGATAGHTALFNKLTPQPSHRMFKNSAGTICLALPQGRDE